MADFDLFTSLRYDPKLRSTSFNTDANGGSESPYLLFSYHVQRLAKAAEAFAWPLAIQTMSSHDIDEIVMKKCEESILQVDEQVRNIGLRIRILLSIDGQIRVETYPTIALIRDPLAAVYFNPDQDTVDKSPKPVLTVSLDTQPTTSSPFTSFKTTSRAHYDAARSRIGIISRTDPREVILYNDRGEITEGSFRNVSFWRGGKWVTPPGETGCLPGTVRRWLMENGLLHEQVIKKDDIKPGEWVMMSNGVDITILGKMN